MTEFRDHLSLVAHAASPTLGPLSREHLGELLAPLSPRPGRAALDLGGSPPRLGARAGRPVHTARMTTGSNDRASLVVLARCAGLLATLAGCDAREVEAERQPPAVRAASSTFEQGSARVALPSGFGAVAADEERALARAMSGDRERPASYLFAARRLADRSAMVILQHETTPLVARGGERAGDFLSGLLDALRELGSGASAAERRRDGGVEQCVEVSVRDGMREHSCTFAWIDAEEQRVALDTVSCLAEPAQRALCRRVMESREYAPSAALPLTSALSPTASPGLPEIGPDHVLWARFGMSRAEFQAACRSAGERADEVDLTREPPMVRAWFREGKMSSCSGLGESFSLGEATLVHALFHLDGGLAEVHVFLAAPVERTAAAMRSAYPDWMPNGEQTVHFVDRNASGYEVVGISTAPSASRPARSRIVVQTRAALDRPPL